MNIEEAMKHVDDKLKELSTDSVDNYATYRGKCKLACDMLIDLYPSLTLVRGWYLDPFDKEYEHWWTVDESGYC